MKTKTNIDLVRPYKRDALGLSLFVRGFRGFRGFRGEEVLSL